VKLVYHLKACKAGSRVCVTGFLCYVSCLLGLFLTRHQVTYDVGFNPSTQRHYRKLIYYLYIHSYMFRSCDHHQGE
jgi:hypothetical protein